MVGWFLAAIFLHLASLGAAFAAELSDPVRDLQSCSAGAAPNGALGCAPCLPGTSAPAGAAACQPCRAGYYALGGASACTQCPEDFFCADPTRPPARCTRPAEGTIARGDDPSTQVFYALPGSTRCWPQCTDASEKGAKAVLFQTILPCVGGFTDIPFQAQWPFTPLDTVTQKSLYTGQTPS